MAIITNTFTVAGVNYPGPGPDVVESNQVYMGRGLEGVGSSTFITSTAFPTLDLNSQPGIDQITTIKLAKIELRGSLSEGGTNINTTTFHQSLIDFTVGITNFNTIRYAGGNGVTFQNAILWELDGSSLDDSASPIIDFDDPSTYQNIAIDDGIVDVIFGKSGGVPSEHQAFTLGNFPELDDMQPNTYGVQLTFQYEYDDSLLPVEETPSPADPTPGNWKKVITKGSNAVLNHVTSSGNLVVNGDLYAKLDDAPTNNNNLRVVTIHPSNGLLFITSSYGGSSTSTQIQVKIGAGSYEPLQNIVISNFESNIDIDTSGGTLSIDFN